jgi:hypothetical protein
VLVDGEELPDGERVEPRHEQGGGGAVAAEHLVRAERLRDALALAVGERLAQRQRVGLREEAAGRGRRG